MTPSIARNAEVIRSRRFDIAELRALRARRRGRTCLVLEVTSSAGVGVADDDERYCRFSVYDSEPELITAFERAAAALAS